MREVLVGVDEIQVGILGERGRGPSGRAASPDRADAQASCSDDRVFGVDGARDAEGERRGEGPFARNRWGR
jgi:hypothetical protein